MNIFAKELLSLWNDGITVGTVKFRFAIINGIFDGKGFEQVTKTQGSCSHEGCNACNFPGFSFGVGHRHSVVYPFYNQYLPQDDLPKLDILVCCIIFEMKLFPLQSIEHMLIIFEMEIVLIQG